MGPTNILNVQLSRKKQYLKFLHFLSSAASKSKWRGLKSFWYLHHHHFNQLYALVFAYLFIIICTDPMYVTIYMIAEIFRESSQMTVQPIMHRYELFEIFKSNKLYKINEKK